MGDRDVVVACPCEGTPHVSDTITLYDQLPEAAGMACYAALQMEQDFTVPEITGKWATILGRMGVESWSLVDPKGKALPYSIAHYAALPFGIKAAVANAAMGRWSTELTSPLPNATGNSSRPGPTDDLTSPSRPSGRLRQASSKRSLPNGSAGRPSVAQVP